MADPAFIVNSRFAVKVESTPGVLEGTGTWLIVPFFKDGFSFNPTKQFIEAPIVDATRQKEDVVGGSYETRITLRSAFNNEAGLRFLLESALFGTFSTDTIVAAATRKTFSVEIKSDLATDSFRRCAGCVVDSLKLNVPSQGPVTADWSILGRAASSSASELGSSYTALAGYTSMSGGLTGTSVSYNGSALTGVTNFSMDMANGLAAQYAIGSSSPDHITVDNFKLTGSGSYYNRDTTIFDVFLSEVADDVILVLKSSDASPIKQTCTVTIPATVFTASDLSPEGLTLADKFTFAARYGAGIGSKVQFVFSAA